MNINVEFFSEEVMENLITCLNYKMDQVIFFGHQDIMTPDRMHTVRMALRNICGIKDVKYIQLSNKELDWVVGRIEREIVKQIEQSNQCFFDLTGGESLVMVAMGILSTRYETHMHCYDMQTGELKVFDKENALTIRELAKEQKIKLTLDDVIEMRGGIITHHQQKFSDKVLRNPEFKNDFLKIWNMALEDARQWNFLTGVFRRLANVIDNKLTVTVTPTEFENVVMQSGAESVKKIIALMYRLCELDLLEHLTNNQDMVRFKYKNEAVKECLLDAGSALELHTYYERKESGQYADCRVGVHIDWDGDIRGPEEDVENEIDVLLLKDHIPVFISCKNGRVNQMALYELETVARRFGGKYMQKELVASQQISEPYENRAKEMGIQITYVK